MLPYKERKNYMHENERQLALICGNLKRKNERDATPKPRALHIKENSGGRQPINLYPRHFNCIYISPLSFPSSTYHLIK